MKLVKQKSYQDCGIACLTMLINHYYQVDYDVDQIKFENNLENKDLSFYDISVLAETYFFKTNAYELEDEYSELYLKSYFLAQVINKEGLYHFVVVESFQHDKVKYYDPSSNNKTVIATNEFLKIFLNKVIVFKPNKYKFKNNNQFNYFQFLKIYKYELLTQLFLAIVFSLLFVFESRLFKVYATSIANDNFDISIYIIFISIFITNIFIQKTSIYFLNVLHKKTYIKHLKKYLRFLSENNLEIDNYGVYKSFTQIVNYEVYKLIPALSKAIITIVCLIVIAKIHLLTFFILSINQVIVLILAMVKQKFYKPLLIDEQTNLIKILNFDKFKNNSKEEMIYNSILKFEEDKAITLPFIDAVLEVIDYLSIIVIYIAMWGFLKNSDLDLNLFLIILILKQMIKNNSLFIFNTLFEFKEYQSHKFRINRFFTFNSNKITDINEINNIEIFNYFIDNEFHHFQFKTGVNYTNDIQMGVINRTVEAKLFRVEINQIELENYDLINLRSQIYYLSSLSIEFGTIFKNLVPNFIEINIFKEQVICDLMNKYQLTIDAIVYPNEVKQVHLELINLLQLFNLEQKVILIDNLFYNLDSNDIDTIFNLLESLCNDKIIIIKRDKQTQ